MSTASGGHRANSATGPDVGSGATTRTRSRSRARTTSKRPPADRPTRVVGKFAYRPVGMIAGVVGGLVATRAFNQAWKMLGHQDDAPDAMDGERPWTEILMAAAVQGAIYAVVHAAIRRGGATAFRKATGIWPGH